MSQQSAIPNFSAFVFQCLRISASALCIYEYSITIYEERAYIWKAKLSFPAALFYIIRYSAILDAIWCILELVNWPGKSDLIGNFSCKILLRSELGLKLGLLVSVATLVAVRVYAITQRTVWPVLPTLALYMVNPVVLLYLGIISQPIIRHGTCNTIGSTDRDTYVMWTNIAGATTIASNGLALFITWLVTASIVTMRQLSTSKETLSIVLMNHGGIHFTLLSIAAVIGMAAGRNTEISSGITGLVIILTSVVMCRFILDLRRVTDATNTHLSGEFGMRTMVLTSNASAEVGAESDNGELDHPVDVECEYAAVGVSHVDLSAHAQP